MKGVFRKIGCAAVVLFVGSSAMAGTVVCSGTVEALSYHASGTFMIRLSSMNIPVFFCRPDSEFSVSGTTYTTPPETCKTLYATFLAARESGRTISGMYFDGDDVPTTCDTWGPWKSANIRYFVY